MSSSDVLLAKLTNGASYKDVESPLNRDILGRDLNGRNISYIVQVWASPGRDC